MDIAKVIGIFWTGAILGFLLCWWILPRLRPYSGIIHAVPNETDDKVVYSLVLFNNPSSLIFEKEVLFKVVTSVEEDDRE